MSIKKKIIDLIRKNRISTTEVADCLNKTGAIPEVYALNAGHFRVGEVFWTYAWNESNWENHEQLRHAQEGQVVLVEPFQCGDRAVFGSLVTKFLFLYRQVQAVVVLGKLRDAPHLLKENWAIWVTGVTPIGCFNKKNKISLDPEIIQQRHTQYDGAIGVCDDSGVVIIPPSAVNETFIEKLEFIEEQEDIWFECIDRRKWDTYDTVCLKKYKEDNT